jgi:hypothetical protein
MNQLTRTVKSLKKKTGKSKAPKIEIQEPSTLEIQLENNTKILDLFRPIFELVKESKTKEIDGASPLPKQEKLDLEEEIRCLQIYSMYVITMNERNEILRKIKKRDDLANGVIQPEIQVRTLEEARVKY